MPYLPNGTYAESPEEYRIKLLKRAADSLQAYCETVNGDLNDSLATEITKAVQRYERKGV